MPGKPLAWVLMGLAVVWGAVAMARERITRRKMIEHRPVLGDDEIYRQFYEKSGLPKDTVVRVWHEVSSVLHVDAGKLRPSDLLVQYKTKAFQLRSDIDHLDDWLCMLSQKSKLNPGKLNTLDDVVRFAIQASTYSCSAT